MSTSRIHSIVERCQGLRPPTLPGSVRALVIGGSVGRGEFDARSDIDLFAWTDHCYEPHLTAIATAIGNEVGRVLMMRGPIWVDGFGYSFSLLYDDLTVCQLNLNDVDADNVHPMRAQPCVICFDPDGWYADLRDRSSRANYETGAMFRNALTLFTFRSIGVSRSLQRGELWFAIQHLNDLRDQIFIMNRLLVDQLPPGLQMRAPAKAIERQLAAYLPELSRALPQYSQASIAKVLCFSMEHFHSVAARMAQRISAADFMLVRQFEGVKERIAVDLAAFCDTDTAEAPSARHAPEQG